MKHDIIQADLNKGKINFIFECKYFDSKGDVNKIKKVKDIKNFFIFSFYQKTLLL